MMAGVDYDDEDPYYITDDEDDEPKEEDLLPPIRERGSHYSVAERTRNEPEVDPFATCDFCNQKLTGCIIQAGGEEEPVLLTCGHVVCRLCLTDMRSPEKPTLGDQKDRNHVMCVICNYGVTDISVPIPNVVNEKACQAAYCTGESFSNPQFRCRSCQRQICEGCVAEHNVRFPGHDIHHKPCSMASQKRRFLGCRTHFGPIVDRCACGEMMCKHCHVREDYTLPPDRKIKHARHSINDIDLVLEDKMEDGNVPERLEEMIKEAYAKKTRIRESVDNMNNEIACQMNLIILQTIQRCWEMMNAVKKAGNSIFLQLEQHERDLRRVQRQIVVGVEVDERARQRRLVKPENVSNLLRHVGYALCEPAFAEMHRLQTAHEQFGDVVPVIEIDIQTEEILKKIGTWGTRMMSNLGKITEPPKVSCITPTSIVQKKNVDGTPIEMPLSGKLVLHEIPTRLHLALDMYEDMYQLCFDKVTNKENEAKNKIRFFALGGQLRPDHFFDAKQIEDRERYLRIVHERPGVLNMPPKILGGYQRILNLRELEPSAEELKRAYKNTPICPPLWRHEPRVAVPSTVPAVSLISSEPRPPEQLRTTSHLLDDTILKKKTPPLPSASGSASPATPKKTRFVPARTQIPGRTIIYKSTVSNRLASLERAIPAEETTSEDPKREAIDVSPPPTLRPALGVHPSPPRPNNPNRVIFRRPINAPGVPIIIPRRTGAVSSVRYSIPPLRRGSFPYALPPRSTTTILRTATPMLRRPPILVNSKMSQSIEKRRAESAQRLEERVREIEREESEESGEVTATAHIAFPKRSRGRPRKDDITAPSNQRIIEPEPWPPAVAALVAGSGVVETPQDKIETIVGPLFQDEDEGHAIKQEIDEDSPWMMMPSTPERARLREAYKLTEEGCFVCNLFRVHHKKPKTWRCDECVKANRPLFPSETEPTPEPSEPVKRPKKRAAVTTLAKALIEAVGKKARTEGEGEAEGTEETPKQAPDNTWTITKSGRMRVLPKRYREGLEKTKKRASSSRISLEPEKEDKVETSNARIEPTKEPKIEEP